MVNVVALNECRLCKHDIVLHQKDILLLAKYISCVAKHFKELIQKFGLTL